jgi:hypothetical protein
VTWIYIVAGLVLLISPLNLRYQFAKVRRRVIEDHGELERFDGFLGSRLIRALNLVLPAAGLVLIVLGAVGA